MSEFVSFITSEASDRCHQEKRKTINGEDILFAMSSLGFDNYVEPLKLYLQKYREANKGDKSIVGATGEGGDSSGSVGFPSVAVSDGTSTGQPNIIEFTYNFGVQPTPTTSAGNGNNFTVG